jgi:cytochrome c-type biogenesis protein CcmH/NrfG
MPLPAALLLLDVYPLRRRGGEWRRLIVEKLPYVLLAAAAAAVALVALWFGGPVTSYKQYGPVARGAMVVYSLMFYPVKFVFPAGLSPMYELPVQVHLTSPQFLGPLLVLAVITIVLVWLRRRWVAGLVVWSYSALMVLPTSGVVHAGLQLAHDRYSYLSGLGFAVLAGSAVVWVLDRRLKGGIGPWMIPALICGAALIVAALGFSSWGQSQIWRNSESLWRWAVDIDPDCSLCYLNLSEAVIADAKKRNSAGAASRASEAEAYARRALALRPSSAKPYFNLGSLLVVQQRYGEAEVALRAYISLDPRDPAGPERLGLLYLVMDRPAEAIPLLRQSLTMDPASDARRTSIVTALRQRANLLRDGEGPNEAVVLEREAAALTARRR